MKHLLKILIIPFSLLINFILKKMKLFVLFRFGKAIGDQVCMSGVIKLINEQYNYKVIIFSNFPEIFYNNPRVLKSVDLNSFKQFTRFFMTILRLFQGTQIENFLFQYKNHTLESYMSMSKNDIHLIHAHSLHFKSTLQYDNLKCEIYFSEDELLKYKEKFNLPKVFSLVQPIGKVSFTPNKEWGSGNFQIVVKNFTETCWIQIGLNNETLLNNVLDYRGKTNLRELFYLISKAEFVLGNEGLLNHIASAFIDTKSVVIFSGFSNVDLAKYDNTLPIYNPLSLECKPCWRLEECDILGKPCMDGITPERVSLLLNAMG